MNCIILQHFLRLVLLLLGALLVDEGLQIAGCDGLGLEPPKDRVGDIEPVYFIAFLFAIRRGSGVAFAGDVGEGEVVEFLEFFLRDFAFGARN